MTPARLLAAFLGSAGAALSHADPVAAAHLPADLGSADTVVVGHVVDLRPSPGPGPGIHRAAWQVDRVLHAPGRMRPGDHLTVRFDRPTVTSMQPGSWALLVLACAGTSDCAPVDADRPGWPAMPGGPAEACPRAPAPTSLPAAATLELAAVIASADRRPGPQTDGSSLVAGADLSLREDAIEGLRTLPRAETQAALAACPPVATSRVARLSWLAAALEVDASADLAASTPDMLDDDPAFADARRLVVAALEAHSSPAPRWTAPLVAWLSARDVEVRRGASSALSRLADDDASAALLATGIVDEDAEVRFRAVQGLVLHRGDGHVPGVEAFRTDEARWLAPWLARRGAAQPLRIISAP